ncbi:g-protein alpha subunit, partial [Ostertagia ostertagi]
MYDGISAIFFCIAISEYDQMMDEDPEMNRLQDALALLEKINKEPKFQKTPFLLFLNEVDVFREKLPLMPLQDHWPDYKGSFTQYAELLWPTRRERSSRVVTHLMFVRLFNEYGTIRPCKRSTKRRSEINLNDSSKYFLENLASINTLDFTPTPRDLIMSYVPTVGVQNVIFSVDNHVFQLFDIGGQRIDRRKWATMYDGISAIFFCIAISEYDQMMDEDPE